jgi:hypothetical protein
MFIAALPSVNDRRRCGDRVNDIVVKGVRLADRKRTRANSFESIAAARVPPPEDAVFAAAIDADHRPHSMIVRRDGHRRPQEILRMVRSPA